MPGKLIRYELPSEARQRSGLDRSIRRQFQCSREFTTSESYRPLDFGDEHGQMMACKVCAGHMSEEDTHREGE